MQTSRIGRRGFVRRVGAMGLASVTSGAHGLLAAGSTASPRTLALIGDRYHNADYIRTALARLFKTLDLPIDFTIAYEKVSDEFLNGYQILITLRDGMNWPDGYLGPDAYSYTADLENPGDFPAAKPEMWMSEEQGQAVKRFVENGGGLYAMHNSTHISVASKNYRDVMGGAYLGHPPLRPFKVRVTNPDHPITRGVSDFMVTDEQHYMTYDKDPKNIILQSENIDGLRYETYGTKAIAGWAYDYGKGRVAYTSPGHTLHALWQPEVPGPPGRWAG